MRDRRLNRSLKQLQRRLLISRYDIITTYFVTFLKPYAFTGQQITNWGPLLDKISWSIRNLGPKFVALLSFLFVIFVVLKFLERFVLWDEIISVLKMVKI